MYEGMRGREGGKGGKCDGKGEKSRVAKPQHCVQPVMQS